MSIASGDAAPSLGAEVPPPPWEESAAAPDEHSDSGSPSHALRAAAGSNASELVHAESARSRVRTAPPRWPQALLAGADDEQVRLMEERVIVTDYYDNCIGAGSKKESARPVD